jgi:hypothetical protein
MKNILPVLTVLLTSLLAGCEKGGKQPAASSSHGDNAVAAQGIAASEPPFAGGRKTSFQEVTSQLDPGGSLLLYLATDQWLGGLSTNISQLREIAFSLAGPQPEKRDDIARGFDLVTRLVAGSGVEDVTGVGMSSAPVAPELYRNKLILHHPSGAGQGFLWSLFGRQPHALDAQEMLPANTAVAFFGDLDLAQLWRVIELELKQSGIPDAADAARTFPEMFEKQTGVPLLPLLASLGGELGGVLTLDESRKVTIPLGPGRQDAPFGAAPGGNRRGRQPGGGRQMEIPAPSLVLFLKTKNDLLFDRLSAKFSENPKTLLSESDGLKFCTLSLDNPPPIPLKPTIATSGDYFYFATSPEAVRALQAVRQGKSPGLKKSAEFQALARHLPAEGNQLMYVSRSFGESIREIQAQAMKESGLPPDQLATIQRLFGAAGSSYSLAIGAHTATGWKTTAAGNQDSSAAILLAPTIGVTAISASLLLPALAKAKGRAQTISSVSQVKQLGLAARIYAVDHGDKFPNAQTWCDDLKDDLGGAGATVFKAPNDPSPGPCSYAMNAQLSGKNEGQVSPQTVLFFEVNGGGWNRSGGSDLLLPRPRGGLYVIGFADGSVQQLPPARIRTLRWNP